MAASKLIAVRLPPESEAHLGVILDHMPKGSDTSQAIRLALARLSADLLSDSLFAQPKTKKVKT